MKVKDTKNLDNKVWLFRQKESKVFLKLSVHDCLSDLFVSSLKHDCFDKCFNLKVSDARLTKT